MVLCLWRLRRGPWWIHFWIGLKEFWLCRWHSCVSVLWILGEPPLCCPGSGSECSSNRALDCCPLRPPGEFCLCAASEPASAPSWGLKRILCRCPSVLFVWISWSCCTCEVFFHTCALVPGSAKVRLFVSWWIHVERKSRACSGCGRRRWCSYPGLFSDSGSEIRWRMMQSSPWFQSSWLLTTWRTSWVLSSSAQLWSSCRSQWTHGPLPWIPG